MHFRKSLWDNGLLTSMPRAGCSLPAASHPRGCVERQRSGGRRRLHRLALIAVLGLPACDESPSDPARLGPAPSVLELNGTASVALADGRTADCTIFLRIEMEQGEEQGDAYVYRGTAGGDAIRTILDEDGSGFSFWPHLHSGATLRATPDSLELMADGHDTTSVRFYRGIMHFRGVRTGPGSAHGDWICAPLDLDSGGWLDTAVTATGTWTISEADD